MRPGSSASLSYHAVSVCFNGGGLSRSGGGGASPDRGSQVYICTDQLRQLQLDLAPHVRVHLSHTTDARSEVAECWGDCLLLQCSHGVPEIKINAYYTAPSPASRRLRILCLVAIATIKHVTLGPCHAPTLVSRSSRVTKSKNHLLETD